MCLTVPVERNFDLNNGLQHVKSLGSELDSLRRQMVKHAARRKKQGLHQLLLDKEAAEEAKLEKRRQKAAEKAAELAKQKAGSDGTVKALDGVKYSGTFGVNFDNAATLSKDEDMLLDEVTEAGKLMKSTRKQNFLKVSKQNAVIKKKEKKERKKAKRAQKTGRIIKRMQE